MSKQFYLKQFSLAWVQFFVYTQLNVKTVLFQTIQFSISSQFSSILSGTTTMGQSGPGRDGNKGVLHIPQSSSITEIAPSDCLEHLLWGGVLPLYREAVDVFYSSSWLGHMSYLILWNLSLQCISNMFDQNYSTPERVSMPQPNTVKQIPEKIKSLCYILTFDRPVSMDFKNRMCSCVLR